MNKNPNDIIQKNKIEFRFFDNLLSSFELKYIEVGNAENYALILLVWLDHCNQSYSLYTLSVFS